MLTFEGKVALVTGAGRGLGKSHNDESTRARITAFLSDKESLQAQDIADGVAFMVTRPRRTSISALWVMPTDQA